MLDRLDAQLRERLRVAYAPRSSGPLGTAVRSFAEFARRVPDRSLFIRPVVAGDLSAQAHNEWTLCLWAVWLAAGTSGKTGTQLKASTIEQRISLFKGLVSHRYGFQIAGQAPRLAALVKSMKQGDPRMGTRRKRRGVRHRHLRKAWRKAAWVRKETFGQLNKWAALTTSRHVLARGGELATVQRKDLSFHISPGGKRYAVLRLRPLKKRAGILQPKVPQIIAEFEGGREACAYAALRRLAEADIWGKDDPDTIPLFRSKPNKAMSTGYYRATVRELAKAVGIDPKQVGAQSTRIGGATDLAGTGQASQLLLQAKGRWSSEIGKIYARMTRRSQLAVSDLMYECKGRDLEEIIPEFVQPI